MNRILQIQFANRNIAFIFQDEVDLITKSENSNLEAINQDESFFFTSSAEINFISDVKGIGFHLGTGFEDSISN